MIADGECFAVLASDYQQEIDSLKDEVERLHKANLRLLGEIRQMRPVVDAAVAWAYDSKKAYAHLLLQLQDAVRAYQNPPKKKIYTFTRDDPMGPVKTCTNCLHDRKGVCAVEVDFGFDENGDCQDWEMKQ